MKADYVDFEVYVTNLLWECSPNTISEIEQIQDRLISSIENCVEEHITENDLG